MANLSIKVKVDDLTFNSIADATSYLGLKKFELSNALKQGDIINYKGHVIERLTPKSPRIRRASACRSLREGTLTLNNINTTKVKQHRVKPRKVPVLCTTTNELYSSISDLARKLNMNAWTLGVKLEVAGKFIDKDGNVYIRQLPMKRTSINPLQPTSATLDENRSLKLRGITHIIPETIEHTEQAKNISGLKMLEQAGVTLVRDQNFEDAAKVFGLLAEIYRK